LEGELPLCLPFDQYKLPSSLNQESTGRTGESNQGIRISQSDVQETEQEEHATTKVLENRGNLYSWEFNL
jgi:hypothetical protein